MRIGLVWERKVDFPFKAGDPKDIDSELLSHFEEDELLSGLRDAGHEVIRIGDATKLLADLPRWRERCDLVFNLSVGYRGVERKTLAAAAMELGGVPYIGSTPYVLTLTRHKFHAKLVVRSADIATPGAVLVDEAGHAHLRLGEVRYPAIVKPVAESSSIGISSCESVVDDPAAALRQALRIIRQLEQPAMIESFVPGAEVEIPLIADPRPRALGVAAVSINGRAIDGNQFLAGDMVYDDANYGFGEPPPYVDRGRALEAAERCASALGIRDYGRMDFRITRDGTPWFMEASTHPHIQSHSSFYAVAKERGVAYPAMLEEIINAAAKRVAAAAAP